MPACESSHTCQSWRFVMSQNSTASAASNPARASSSGWKCHSQMLSCGPDRAARACAPSRSRDGGSGAGWGRSRSSTPAAARRPTGPEETRADSSRPSTCVSTPCADPCGRPCRWPQRLVLAAQVVRELVERRVDDRAMQALGVVLDDQLPVRLRRRSHAGAPSRSSSIRQGPELAGQIRQLLRRAERRCVDKVDEDVPVPGVAPTRWSG